MMLCIIIGHWYVLWPETFLMSSNTSPRIVCTNFSKCDLNFLASGVIHLLPRLVIIIKVQLKRFLSKSKGCSDEEIYHWFTM